MLNSLHLASGGYLSRGTSPALGMAVEGLIRLGSTLPEPEQSGGGGASRSDRFRKANAARSLVAPPRKRKPDDLYQANPQPDADAVRIALEALRRDARELGKQASAKAARETSPEILPLSGAELIAQPMRKSESKKRIELPSAAPIVVVGIDDDEALLFAMSMH